MPFCKHDTPIKAFVRFVCRTRRPESASESTHDSDFGSASDCDTGNLASGSAPPFPAVSGEVVQGFIVDEGEVAVQDIDADAVPDVGAAAFTTGAANSWPTVIDGQHVSVGRYPVSGMLLCLFARVRIVRAASRRDSRFVREGPDSR